MAQYKYDTSNYPVGFERKETCRCHINNRVIVSIPIAVHTGSEYDDTATTDTTPYVRTGLISIDNSGTVKYQDVKVLEDRRTIVSNEFDVGDIVTVKYFAAPENTVLGTSCLNGDRITAATLYNWMSKANDAPSRRLDFETDINSFSDTLACNQTTPATDTSGDVVTSYVTILDYDGGVGSWLTTQAPFYATGLWIHVRSLVDMSSIGFCGVWCKITPDGGANPIELTLDASRSNNKTYTANVYEPVMYTGTGEYAYTFYIPLGYLQCNSDFKVEIKPRNNFATNVNSSANVINNDSIAVSWVKDDTSARKATSTKPFDFEWGNEAETTAETRFKIGQASPSEGMIDQLVDDGVANIDSIGTASDLIARFVCNGTYTVGDNTKYCGYAAQLAGHYHD